MGKLDDLQKKIEKRSTTWFVEYGSSTTVEANMTTLFCYILLRISNGNLVEDFWFCVFFPVCLIFFAGSDSFSFADFSWILVLTEQDSLEIENSRVALKKIHSPPWRYTIFDVTSVHILRNLLAQKRQFLTQVLAELFERVSLGHAFVADGRQRDQNQRCLTCSNYNNTILEWHRIVDILLSPRESNNFFS